MKALIELLTTKPWIGDVASVAGFIVGLFGFGWTIWLAWRSKTAAEQAREEAQRVRQALSRTWTVADLSAVIAKMDEIKRLHRATSLATTSRNRAIAWAVLPDRYTELRQLLIAVRERSPHLNEEHQTAIQSALGQLKGIENAVARSFGDGDEVPDPVGLNDIVSGEMDSLISIFEMLKHEVGT